MISVNGNLGVLSQKGVDSMEDGERAEEVDEVVNERELRRVYVGRDEGRS
jgi:hypothetical protein